MELSFKKFLVLANLCSLISYEMNVDLILSKGVQYFQNIQINPSKNVVFYKERIVILYSLKQYWTVISITENSYRLSQNDKLTIILEYVYFVTYLKMIFMSLLELIFL